MDNRYFADISSYQPHFDAMSYRGAGHLLIMIKATEGLHYESPDYAVAVHNAHNAGLGVVHYHFARPDLGDSPHQEAVKFLEVVLPHTTSRDYLEVDVERATPEGYKHDPEWVYQFDAVIRERSRFNTILYANASTLAGYDWKLYGEPQRCHCADYSAAVNTAPRGFTCVFRQFTDGIVGPEPHYFAGIGQCDGNHMAVSIFRHLQSLARC